MASIETPRNYPDYSLSLGAALGAFYACLGYFIFTAVSQPAYSHVLTHSFLLGIPFGLGAIVAVLAPPERQRSFRHALIFSLLALVIFYVAILLTTQAALIPYVVFFPLMLLAGLAGGLLFVTLQRALPQRAVVLALLLVILALPYFSVQWEAVLSPANQLRQVETAIAIDAAPETVWANIVRVAPIQPEEQQFNSFHALGIPQPLEARMLGDGPDGTRFGLFSEQLLFVEQIHEWQPGRAISFDIEAQNTEALPPPLDQIGGPYFAVLQASYRIEPQPDGGVQLHLSSLHRLSTPVNWYAGWWTDLIMDNFQGYVLRLVKQRAEAAN